MNVPGRACRRHHSWRFQAMKMISGAARTVVCRAGVAAAAVLALSAASQQRAEALSLASPGTVPAAKYASEAMTIEVRGGHGGHGGGGFRGGGGGGFRGGGAAFHGGGFRGGGAMYRGGVYRAGPAFYRGGGYRYGAPGIARRHYVGRHYVGARRAYFHHR